jgi:hypothetical protein
MTAFNVDPNYFFVLCMMIITCVQYTIQVLAPSLRLA